MATPDLSVCIVNWNTRSDLEQAITTSVEADPALSMECVVVDNASTDGSAQMVRERFPQVTLIENTENAGFARGYNRAVQEARGRHLFILNPDTTTRPGALRTLVDFMDSHPEAGASAPRILNPDGSLQFSCRRFPKPMAAVFRNTPLGALVPRNRFTRDYLMTDWDHEAVREVDWASGAALCVRRECWDEVGGFDENFFMYAEDMDWCLRAHRAGWQIHYVPQAAIVHRIGSSSDQRPFAVGLHFHRSMARFYLKHYAKGWPWALRWLPLAGIWARAGVVLIETAWRVGGDRCRRLLRGRP